MAKKKYDVDFSKVANRIIKTSLEDFVEESYLPFAHYVIMNRALISDDGLKPVQRRILFAMLELGLTDKKEYMKAAQIVGEVMGKYHPHGDSSISDALARMGQKFSLRVPLVDVFGSVGHTTGDVPAAPRYWEGRPTAAAMEALKDLKDGAIEMGLNYDGRFEEPSILPVRWPIGIINGSQGIAVGYASSIISHNPTEIMNACIKLVEKPDMTLNELMRIVKGPDFPTGGVLIGLEGVKEYFETGKGSFSVRGQYKIEPGARGTHVITFFEAPYQVSGEQIIESIQKNKKDRDRFKEISYAKELSDKKNGFMFSIGVKGGANPEVVLRDLFKYTPLEQTFSANTTVLKDGVPTVTPIKTLLEEFIQFRSSCISNKATNKLKSLDKSIERLEGIIKVLVDIDKAISIIRKSDTPEIANEELQKSFKINEEQSSFIMSMPLRRLTKSDAIAINEEINGLITERDYMKLILSDEDEFKKFLIEELESTKKVIGDKRRTVINNISQEELKEEEAEIKKAAALSTKNEDCYIVSFTDGTIVRADSLDALDAKDNLVSFITKAKTQENLIFFKKDGDAIRFPVNYVSDSIVSIETAVGIELNNYVGFSREEIDKDCVGSLVVTSEGGVNIIEGGYPNSKEFPAVKLKENESLMFATTLTEEEFKSKEIVLISSDGYALKFPIEQIRTSRAGAGTVKGMNLTENATVISASIVNVNSGRVFSCSHKTMKLTDLSEVSNRNRGAKGVILQKLQKDDFIIYAFAGDNIKAIKAGKLIKLPQVSLRAIQGVARSGNDVKAGVSL